jgi:hypothetical protein
MIRRLDNTARITQAIRLARIVIVNHIESIEECECLSDENGTPRIDTMTKAARPDWRRHVRVAHLLTEALKELGPCKHDRIEGRGKHRFCLDCETELRGEVVSVTNR